MRPWNLAADPGIAHPASPIDRPGRCALWLSHMSHRLRFPQPNKHHSQRSQIIEDAVDEPSLHTREITLKACAPGIRTRNLAAYRELHIRHFPTSTLPDLRRRRQPTIGEASGGCPWQSSTANTWCRLQPPRFATKPAKRYLIYWVRHRHRLKYSTFPRTWLLWVLQISIVDPRTSV